MRTIWSINPGWDTLHFFGTAYLLTTYHTIDNTVHTATPHPHFSDHYPYDHINRLVHVEMLLSDLRSVVKWGSPSKAEHPFLLNYACGLSDQSPCMVLYTLSCCFLELASCLWSFGSPSTLNYLNLC